MPKSKNKRKNGRVKGSNWNKRIAKEIKQRREDENAVFEKIRQQMLD